LLIVLILAGMVAMTALRYARGRRVDAAARVDDLPSLPPAIVQHEAGTWVIFTTPLCVSCRAVEAELHTAYPSDAVVKVDATQEPQLAERYRVRRAPTVLHADRSGRVLLRLVGADAVRAHVAAHGLRADL
jgi:thiol-disulfide isomerase/thioredoxin